MKRMLLFLGFLLGIVLLLIVIFGLTGRKSSNKTDDVVTATKVFDIDDYADRDSYVKQYLAGPIVGDDEHNEVWITVTPNSRTIDIIQGYQGKVISSKTYANNRAAYEDFLYALGKQNYGKTKETKLVKEGSCATGQLYTFQTYDSSKLVSDVWAGSCTKGNSSGITNKILNLFKAQITDYQEMTSDLNL
jgi:hypothetical protein